MKTREEINKFVDNAVADLDEKGKIIPQYLQFLSKMMILQMEVLLDIREFLSIKKGDKHV